MFQTTERCCYNIFKGRCDLVEVKGGKPVPNLERVVVIGASGWVGSTACNWLSKLDTQVLKFAASSREENTGSRI